MPFSYNNSQENVYVFKERNMYLFIRGSPFYGLLFFISY